MAVTIAEFFLRKWAEENLPGVKVIIEGRCARLTDSNGDFLNILYEPETRRIVCLEGFNTDNLSCIP